MNDIIQDWIDTELHIQIAVLATLVAMAAGDVHNAISQGHYGYESASYPDVQSVGHRLTSTGGLPVNYAAPIHAHLVHVPAPVAPVAYTAGHRVQTVYQPVEQHGYQIVYWMHLIRSAIPVFLYIKSEQIKCHRID